MAPLIEEAEQQLAYLAEVDLMLLQLDRASGMEGLLEVQVGPNPWAAGSCAELAGSLHAPPRCCADRGRAGARFARLAMPCAL